MPNLIRDFILLTLVGAFHVGLSLVQTLNLIDPLSFEYHLTYDSKSTAPSAPRQNPTLVLATLEGLDVYQAGHDLGRDVTSSSKRAISEAWFWNTHDLQEIRKLMNNELTSGTFSATGIVVDASVAEKLGLHLGSQITVQYLEAFTVKKCQAPIVGMTRTYRNIKKQGAPGLVVASAATCPAIWASSSSNGDNVTYSFMPAKDPDHIFITKNSAISQIWDSNSSTSNETLFALLYLTSLGFWVFTVKRVHAGLTGTTARMRRSIVRLGGNQKKLRSAYGRLSLALAVTTIPLASSLAINILDFGPNFAIGLDNILSVVSIQIATTLIAIAFFAKKPTFRLEMKE